MRQRFVLLAVIGFFLLLSFPTPLEGQESSGRPQVGLRPDAPTYALHGSYWVGTQEFVIDQDAKRPLRATIWYPALNPEGSAEAYNYTFDYAPSMGNLPISGHALGDAQPDREHGPYPLVVYSHGHLAQRFAAIYLGEHLASYGFVVMAIDHTGNTSADSGDFYPFFVLRPLDVRRAIDYAETLTASGGALAGVIDIGRVAVSGHSFGGFTALAAGGARFNSAAFKSWCDQYGAQYDPAGGCGQFLGHQQELAALAGLGAAPEGLWPSLSDPRVDAVIGMAADPSARFFGAEGLGSLTVPTLLLVGSGDTASIPEHNTIRAYDYLGSTQKALAVFQNADHWIFFFDCNAAPWLIDIGFFSVCSDPVWDEDRAHDLIDHFTTAFLLDVLKGDKDAAAVLASSVVSFPGIQYQAQGF